MQLLFTYVQVYLDQLVYGVPPCRAFR